MLQLLFGPLPWLLHPPAQPGPRLALALRSSFSLSPVLPPACRALTWQKPEQPESYRKGPALAEARRKAAGFPRPVPRLVQRGHGREGGPSTRGTAWAHLDPGSIKQAGGLQTQACAAPGRGLRGPRRSRPARGRRSPFNRLPRLVCVPKSPLSFLKHVSASHAAGQGHRTGERPGQGRAVASAAPSGDVGAAARVLSSPNTLAKRLTDAPRPLESIW